VEPLDEEQQRREGDAEADERDVDGERQRLHLPGALPSVRGNGGAASART
jgi:hypothetical protein